MLGRIAEQVTGKPLDQLLRSMVFKPHGNVLDATGWSPTFAAAANSPVSTIFSALARVVDPSHAP